MAWVEAGAGTPKTAASTTTEVTDLAHVSPPPQVPLFLPGRPQFLRCDLFLLLPVFSPARPVSLRQRAKPRGLRVPGARLCGLRLVWGTVFPAGRLLRRAASGVRLDGRFPGA